MKHFLYRVTGIAVCLIVIPLLITFLIQGDDGNPVKKEDPGKTSGQTILDESILPGILAGELSVDTEYEAMKAQAVIARTNCLRALEQGEAFPESIAKSDMIRMWGQEKFSEYYTRLESCVEATKGMAMVWNGHYIQAEFHAASAGYTRNANEFYQDERAPYLKSKDSRTDLLSKDFLQVKFYKPDEWLKLEEPFLQETTKEAAQTWTAEQLAAAMAVTERDSAGYVTKVQIDGQEFSGEEIRLASGWNSSDFSIKEIDGEIRVVTKGCGHGLGLSLYGANELARQKKDYQEILQYYFDGIEIVNSNP